MKFIRNFVDFFGYDKFCRFNEIVKQNGGLGKSLNKLFRMETMKTGKLVGQDKYGNKYFENDYYFYGSSRWVEYADYKNFEYDASQVPAEWYGWLHYRTDAKPYEDPVKLHTKYKWMLDHSENQSGTKGAYMPYSTTKPKIEAWNPSEVKSEKK